MPRPDPAAPKEGQIGLFSEPSGPHVTGRAEDEVRRAIAARIAAGHLDEKLDAASNEAAAVIGRALDQAGKAGAFGSVLRNAPGIMDALTAAALTPGTRETAAVDPITALLEELNAAAPIPHTA